MKAFQFGREAEEQASQYLQKKDYQILERNLRIGKAEIDIIAKKDNTLRIIEVKARHHTFFGLPEEAVTKKKIKLLSEAANTYVLEGNLESEVRFDIISIIKTDNHWHIKHIKDAFFPITD